MAHIAFVCLPLKFYMLIYMLRQIVSKLVWGELA
ncbi:hypothetical protein WVIC16_110118 [Weissella viridescens]|nr:hypothetical protein WVIC16_110118 [Weissella viridescens]